MADFMEFNKLVFTSIKDTLTGGQKAEATFLLRQKLKSQTYQALLKLWGEINHRLNENEVEQFDEESRFQKALTDFYHEMLAVYNQFEDETSYYHEGILESVATKIGVFLHKNIFAGSNNFKKEIEYEYEQFWTNFFKLKGCDLLKNDKGKMEELQESIIDIGARTIKMAIANHLEWKKNVDPKNEETETKPKGFSIQAALEKELTQKPNLFIEMDEAEKYANLITQNIGPEWIKTVAENLSENLGHGRMLQLNQNYSISLKTSFVLGNAYATYLCASDYKILFSLIKAGGRFPDLIQKYQAAFEGPTGIKILHDDEDRNFLDDLIKNCTAPDSKYGRDWDRQIDELLSSKTGMMFAVLTQVRELGKELNSADNNAVAVVQIIQKYLAKSQKIQEVIQQFRSSLQEINLDAEFVEIIKTQSRPELYRFWINKPYWANEEADFIKAREFIFHRIHETYDIMLQMVEKSKTAMNQDAQELKAVDEISEKISDESVSAIAYLIASEYESQMLWFLNNTLRVEMEMRRKESLDDIIKWIAESVSRQFCNSLFYRLILVSNEENLAGNPNASDWRAQSGKIFTFLASIPNENKVQSVLQHPIPFDEVSDLYSARAYVENFLKENNIETENMRKFCVEFREPLQQNLIRLLLVQMMHYFPDSITSIELDENINYDLSTFNGVMGEFIRNISAITSRNKAMTH